MEENNNTTDNRTNDTTTDGTTDGNWHSAARPPHRHHRAPSEDRFFKIRNVLNIIFIVGAIAGMATFYLHDRTTGTIVIITAMAFKIVECSLRFIRQ